MNKLKQVERAIDNFLKKAGHKSHIYIHIYREMQVSLAQICANATACAPKKDTNVTVLHNQVN